MTDTHLKQRTLSGMLWAAIQRFGSLAISFLSNIILARLLSPDDYGLIGMLSIFIAVSNTFIDGGFGVALIQKKDTTNKDFSTVFYWNIFLSLFLYFILYISAPLIQKFYDNIHMLSDVLRVLGVVLIINAFTVVQLNRLRKEMKFKLLAKCNLSAAIISVTIAIILAYYGWGVWALVFQQIVYSLFNSIICWMVCHWKPEMIFSLKSFKDLFGFGSFMMFSSLFNTFCNNINGLIIGKFFSATTLGYYIQSKRLEDVSTMGFLSVIEQVSYPMLVEIKEDFSRMRDVLERFNAVILAVLTPIMYTIIIMAFPIIVTLFSNKWLPSVPILQVLGFAGIFLCFQGTNYNAIAAIGKSGVLFRWTLIKRLVGIALTIVPMLFLGLYGFLWGIVFSTFLYALCNMILVAKYINYPLKDQFRSLAPVFFLSTIPFIFCYTFSILSKRFELFTPFTSACIFGIIYLLIYIILVKYLNIKALKDINELTRTVINKFH